MDSTDPLFATRLHSLRKSNLTAGERRHLLDRFPHVQNLCTLPRLNDDRAIPFQHRVLCKCNGIYRDVPLLFNTFILFGVQYLVLLFLPPLVYSFSGSLVCRAAPLSCCVHVRLPPPPPSFLRSDCFMSIRRFTLLTCCLLLLLLCFVLPLCCSDG
jgi:hypothetical protein